MGERAVNWYDSPEGLANLKEAQRLDFEMARAQQATADAAVPEEFVRAFRRGVPRAILMDAAIARGLHSLLSDEKFKQEMLLMLVREGIALPSPIKFGGLAGAITILQAAKQTFESVQRFMVEGDLEDRADRAAGNPADKAIGGEVAPCRCGNRPGPHALLAGCEPTVTENSGA